MVKISLIVRNTIAEPFEAWCCEEGISNWGIEKIDDKHPTELFGYFENAQEADENFKLLRNAFPEIPETYKLEDVCDCDWQNEYKKFLTAWNYKDLNWVPLWQKGEFVEPENQKVFYFHLYRGIFYDYLLQELPLKQQPTVRYLKDKPRLHLQ